jgi:DnaK suppressor protein
MKREQIIRKLENVLRRRRDALCRSISGEIEQVNPVDEHRIGDEADAALDAGFRDLYSGLVEAESRELANIEHALEQLDEGTYGTCEHCLRKIPIARLQALPYATTCVKCQAHEEKGTWSEEDRTGNGAQEWSETPR